MIQPSSHFSKKINAKTVKTKTGYVDLHLHTCLSDGQLTVEQLIRTAKSKGLKCISITDHDDMDSYRQGKALAEELDIELIPGIELSTVHNGKDIHILAYFCDITNLAMNLELAEQARRRQTRVRAIIRKLNSLGIDLTYEKVQSYRTGRVIGRPHIANALLAEEYVGSFNDAFNRYLGDKGKAFVEKKGITPQQSIKIIENAGGIAVMAHPYKTNADYLIEDLVECGLKGIETYSYGQKGNIGKKYREIVRKYNLVGTGGSDYHNANSGAAMGSLRIPYNVVTLLKEAREKSRAQWF